MSRFQAPDRGDLVWLDFNPQSGREQAGRRPAVVVSPREYNAKAGLALVCPITRKSKGYPFELELPGGEEQGVALVDQVRAVDWRARHAEARGRVPAGWMEELAALLCVLVKGT